MSDKWSIVCLTTTCFWIWFLLGYSVFDIAYASYGMGYAKGAQCRYLDDTIWLADTTSALCDYLFSDSNNNGPGVHTTTVVKARCLAAMETRVASVAKVAGESKCSSSIFALSPPWTRAFWAGVGLFACYWVLFAFSLGSMAIEACGDYYGVGDGLGEKENSLDKHGDMEEIDFGRIQLD